MARAVLQELFSVLAAPDYVASIVTGGLLVVATIVAAPELVARWNSLRAPRAARAHPAATP